MKFKLVLLILLTSATIGASDAMSQWVQTDGPYGGAVVALAVKGSNLFAATTATVGAVHNKSHWHWLQRPYQLVALQQAIGPVEPRKER